MKRLSSMVFTTLVLVFLFKGYAAAHGIGFPAIVDTDMAMDDMRAMMMILNSGTADVQLMATSDGALPPQRGARNLKAIAVFFGKGNIPVAQGRVLGGPAPPWRSWLSEVRVPETADKNLVEADALLAAEEISTCLRNTEGGIFYLCLGPLTNLADAIRKSPEIKRKITRVLYLGGDPESAHPGWNTLRDTESARFVFNSGLRIFSLGLPEASWLPFDGRLYGEIQKIHTPSAHLLVRVHENPKIAELLWQNHFKIWDEMIVIFLARPSAFRFVPSSSPRVKTLVSFHKEAVLKTYVKLLGFASDFHLESREPVVLKDFPADPALFAEDLAPYVQKIVERHGFEEWKACLLTNEIHRHLGAYSLIGAKMGIRAREILEAPFDTLTVTSFAGLKPPLSCMNDGLQVATGASLGRGAIQVSKDRYEPGAIFFFGNAKLTLKLKESYASIIRDDIEAALDQYGGTTQEYFSLIRKRSLQYWLNWDRQEMFEEGREP